MTTVISAKGLVAGYGKVTIVRDIDLEIREGEVVALLGPNGAGKTTTLMTLAGDLKPLGGTVSCLGLDGNTSLHRRAPALGASRWMRTTSRAGHCLDPSR